MHYLDTNVLIYACVNQDYDKMKQSQTLILKLQRDDKLVLSPLCMQEFIFYKKVSGRTAEVKRR